MEESGKKLATSRRWSIFAAVLVAAAAVYPIASYLYDRFAPYDRYQPFCLKPTGGYQTVAGNLKPAFYNAVWQRIAKYSIEIPGAEEYVIYLKRQLTTDDEDWIYHYSSAAAYSVLQKDLGISDKDWDAEIKKRSKQELAGYFDKYGSLTCYGLQQIAIAPKQ